jgi:hypothetical protein
MDTYIDLAKWHSEEIGSSLEEAIKIKNLVPAFSLVKCRDCLDMLISSILNFESQKSSVFDKIESLKQS